MPIDLEDLANALREADLMLPENDQDSPESDEGEDECWQVGGDGYLEETKGL